MSTEQPYGSWSDRFTLPELCARLDEIAKRHYPLTVRAAAKALRGTLEVDASLADEVRDIGMRIAKYHGGYDDAAILGDAGDAIEELAEERAADLNVLPQFETVSRGNEEPPELRALPAETDDEGLPL